MSELGFRGVAVCIVLSPSLQTLSEMTEEAEKLISTGEEEKDEVIGEKENVNNGGLEMKTDSYDLVVLGASGFTGNYPKIVVKSKQDHMIFISQASMWSSMCSEL